MTFAIACGRRLRCSEPDNLTEIKARLYSDIYSSNLTDASFFLIPEYRMRRESAIILTGNVVKQKRQRRIRRYRLPGNSKCNHRRNTGSTCPHFMVLDYDDLRIPEVLAKAQCSCRLCRTPHSNACQLIESFVPVIRKYCDSTDSGEMVFKYWVDIEKVGVGCTCLMNQIVNQD